MGGGAQWTGDSVDPFKNVMYVTANNIPAQITIKKIGVNRYVDVVGDQLRDLNGYPGVKPPWGTLSAINLNTGKIEIKINIPHSIESNKNRSITWRAPLNNSVNICSWQAASNQLSL